MSATARIRWERNDDGSHVTPAHEGYVGTISEPLFFIFEPDDRDPWWILTSQLPGLPGAGRAERRAHGDDTDGLKAEAERWLEEFVTSLGAIFPGGHPDGNAIEAYCATGTGDGRHLLQYAVRLPDGTTKAYGDQSWVESGLGARDHEEGSSTVVRDIWVSYGPWRTHGTSPATAGGER